MIFLTVGSEIRFDRLVLAVDDWCGTHNRSDVYGQVATLDKDGYVPSNFEWTEFLSPDEYRRKYDEAELIVGHAGMGSIITALMKAKPILIMPRLAINKETRNDHQVATAKWLSEREGVFIAENESTVGSMLDKWEELRETITLEPVGPYAEDRLIKTIRNFIRANNSSVD
jgi:exopolysaccharide biosynthesis glucuronosyltransferase PssE